MNRALHLTALLLALLVAGRAVMGNGQTLTVCKFSGKVMTDCLCPHPVEQTHAELERGGCCDVLKTAPVRVPARTPVSVVASVTPVVAVTAVAWLVPTLFDVADASSFGFDASPPKRGPLYVALRQLLL